MKWEKRYKNENANLSQFSQKGVTFLDIWQKKSIHVYFFMQPAHIS